MSTQKRKVKNEEKSDLEKKTSNKKYAKTIFFFFFFFLGTLTFKVRLWEKHSNLFKIENRCCA